MGHSALITEKYIGHPALGTKQDKGMAASLDPKRDQGRAAILPYDLKATRAVQPALGPKRDIGQHALTTKRGQGSPPWERKGTKAACPGYQKVSALTP